MRKIVSASLAFTMAVGLSIAGVPVLVREANAAGTLACNGTAHTGSVFAFGDVEPGDLITVSVTVTAVTTSPLDIDVVVEGGPTTTLSFTSPGTQQTTRAITAADNAFNVSVSVGSGAGTFTQTRSCVKGGATTSSNGSQARLDALFSAEPDRNRLRRRLNGETEPTIQPVNFSAFGASGSFDGRFSAALSQVSSYAANESGLANDPFAGVRQETQRTDIWVEGYLRRYWSDAANADRDGTLGIVYGGIDYTLTDDVLIGFLAQLDWGEETIGATNTTTDGVGWMAGPYATIQLSDDIFFDVRAAWGTSSNDQNTAGVTASFDTTRWLVAAQLSGDWHHEAWRVTPIASLRYGRERTDSDITSATVAVAANTTTIGRATFGPEIGYAHVFSEGTIWEPFVALHGIWDFAGDDTVTVGAVTDTLSDWRAEAELGLSSRWVGGAGLRASLAYDGLGTDDLEAVSGRLWVNIPLN
jgi:outer membrane autotransporter protein